MNSALVPSSQPETPTPTEARLRELAAITAQRCHVRACREEAGNGGHSGGELRFKSCTHPDCVLVRSAFPVVQDEAPKAINNGNLFRFCDFTNGTMGCVRGAGHDGPHAITLPPYPQQPVMLLGASRPSPAPKETK